MASAPDAAAASTSEQAMVESPLWLTPASAMTYIRGLEVIENLLAREFDRGEDFCDYL